MSERHNREYRTQLQGLARNAQELHTQGKVLKGMGWVLGAAAVGVAAVCTMKYDMPKEVADSRAVGFGVLADVGALAGAAALFEGGRRSQRRADTYEAALLQAGEYKTLADRIEESARLIEVAIDDATMEQLAAREVPELPSFGEPEAYL